MDFSEILINVFGYLFVAIIFAGIPLFFLYLFARDISQKIKRKDRLTQFLRTWKIGNPFMMDVEKLIIGKKLLPLYLSSSISQLGRKSGLMP